MIAVVPGYMTMLRKANRMRLPETNRGKLP